MRATYTLAVYTYSIMCTDEWCPTGSTLPLNLPQKFARVKLHAVTFKTKFKMTILGEFSGY